MPTGKFINTVIHGLDILKIFLVSLLFSSQVDAIFFYGRIWEKKNLLGEKHYIVGLGDCHIEHNDTQKQIVDLMSAIPTDALLVVECMTDLFIKTELNKYHINYRKKLNWVHARSHWITLSDLVFLADKLAIPCVNVEFRLSEDTLSNCLQDNIQPTFSDLLTRIRSVAKENFDAINSLPAVSANNIKKIYKENFDIAIHFTNGLMLFCLSLEHALLQQSIAMNKEFDEEFCKIHFPKLYQDGPIFFKTSSIVDLLLNSQTLILDVLLLEQIINHSPNRDVFICAGAAHLKRINSALEKLGYSIVANKQIGSNEILEEIPTNISSMNIQDFIEPLFPKIRLIDRFGDPLMSDTKKNQLFYGFVTVAALTAYFMYKYVEFDIFEKSKPVIIPKPVVKELPRIQPKKFASWTSKTQ